MGSRTPQHHAGLMGFIRKLFFRKHQLQPLAVKKLNEEELHVEPKYWPEVRDFINNLNHIIETHTIEDSNVAHINQRIVEYVEQQINKKGQLADINQRYYALDTLADRLLSNTFNKIVGLKHVETTHADFTDAVAQFKNRLHARYKGELALKQQHAH
jgi:hypothetical protein